ncbi:F-box/LRR-repeat protein 17-like isoform X2 [Papio anubis]|uniref:F-box/LRR-repeat protein 17-like isoform X2 n=1 Tax=Papio anubis TaxID=9555 RepID=UPI0012ADFAA5|nr:F-box/LRR-repeat protein 17-like isoform X2 [Papio anubis]XP_031522239.1 F-box/LRR-repeat protein 17-like isoform X2 [Papio anubis]
MGHLLSKEPRNRPSQKRPRCCSWCRRRRPLLRLPRRTPAKVPPQPAAPRSRDCFFRGPCMLCFIVHSPGAPAPAGPEEEPPLSPPPPPRDGAYAAASSSQHLARRYAALAAEDCAAAARRFLLSSAAAAAAAAASASSPASCCKELGLAAAAAWEQQGRSLFLASLGPVRFLGPPAAVQLFRGPTPQPAEPLTPPEMVCKRKGAGVPACTPCKQPRCGGGGCGGGGGGGGGGGPAGGGASPPRPPDAGCCQGPEQHPQPLCPPPSSPTSEGAPTEAGGDAVRAGGTAPSSAQQQHECGDADCREPPENPCDCHREPSPETPDINQLPPSILLKIFSNLSLDERCLSASLVCKYWRDLCLDFQFWKQLDLSSRQQVTDELLEKIASRSQNIIEINISDCRSMSDTGVCVLAFKCPGLLRYTAYRCKQLSDTSIIAVASHCPLLQKVHVGNQDKLTDEGLKQLGSKCRELKDIHFGQCYKISDEGMIVIAKGCLKLQRIYMQENKLNVFITTFKLSNHHEVCSVLEDEEAKIKDTHSRRLGFTVGA